LRFAVASVLLKNGYLKSVLKKGKKITKTMELGLTYDAGKPHIAGTKKISKSSCRVYLGAKDIPSVRHGYGHLILSTPKGILTGSEARKMKVGGEALFKIW
jgi:small subunit ribosomal protein S8